MVLFDLALINTCHWLRPLPTDDPDPPSKCPDDSCTLAGRHPATTEADPITHFPGLLGLLLGHNLTLHPAVVVDLGEDSNSSSFHPAPLLCALRTCIACLDITSMGPCLDPTPCLWLTRSNDNKRCFPSSSEGLRLEISVRCQATVLASSCSTTTPSRSAHVA